MNPNDVNAYNTQKELCVSKKKVLSNTLYKPFNGPLAIVASVLATATLGIFVKFLIDAVSDKNWIITAIMALLTIFTALSVYASWQITFNKKSFGKAVSGGFGMVKFYPGSVKQLLTIPTSFLSAIMFLALILCVALESVMKGLSDIVFKILTWIADFLKLPFVSDISEMIDKVLDKGIVTAGVVLSLLAVAFIVVGVFVGKMCKKVSKYYKAISPANFRAALADENNVCDINSVVIPEPPMGSVFTGAVFTIILGCALFYYKLILFGVLFLIIAAYMVVTAIMFKLWYNNAVKAVKEYRVEYDKYVALANNVVAAAAEVAAAQAVAAPAVEAEVAPAVEAEVAPAVEAEVAPAVEAEAAPAVEAEVAPAVEAEAAPAVEAEVAPAVEAEVAPAVEAEVAPAVEAEAAPAVEAVAEEETPV